MKIATVAAALLLVMAAELAAGPSWPEVVGDALAGAALLAGGGIATARRSSRVVGLLLLAAGAAWLAGLAEGSLAALHRGPLVHAVLLGAPRRRPAVAAIIAAYVTGAVSELAVLDAVTLGVGVLVAVAAPGPRAPAAVAVGGALGLAGLAGLADTGLDEIALWTYYGAVAFAGALLARPPRPDVTGLVAELGNLDGREALRDRLARAIGDPELLVSFPPAAAPEPLPQQARMDITEEGELVAVLVHDRTALADAELRKALESCVRLAVANARLQAEIVARANEVAASRRRLVVAAATQRRALERELRASAGRRLGAVAQRLAALDGDAMPAIHDELERAQADLERLARGLHPRGLEQGGLAVALEELAAASTLPIELVGRPRRFAPALEATAYFVAAEALANAAKHSGAARVCIELSGGDARFRLRVTDDGRGGADPRGSGLLGLRDRVEALGGRLHIDSPPGSGTEVLMELPLA
jgi:signal transduction histidine kinase